MCEFLSLTDSERQLRSFLAEKNIALSPIEDDDDCEDSNGKIERIDLNAFFIRSQRTNNTGDPEEEILSFINDNIE